MISKKILITGFEPFGGETINPSFEIVKNLQLDYANDPNFIFTQLPVEYDLAQKQLKELIEKNNPRIWLGLGQAGGRDKINLERVALNWKEVDSNAYSISPGVLREGGASAYFNSLDLNNLKQHLNKEGINSDISLSAGGYICNAVYYTWFESSKNSIGLFVHLPYLPEQHIGKPNLDFQIQLKSVKLILNFLMQL